MYDEGEFSIMDIPQASDEEIASNILESTTSEEDKFNNEPTVQINAHTDVKEESAEDMEAKLKEIMSQNIGDFSINDIPVASDAELSANKVLDNDDGASTAFADEVTDDSVQGIPQEESAFGQPISDDGISEEGLPLPKPVMNEDKAFMQNLVFESQKVLQQNQLP